MPADLLIHGFQTTQSLKPVALTKISQLPPSPTRTELVPTLV